MPKAKQLPSGSWRCRVYIPKTATSPATYKSITAPTRKQAEMEAALFDLQKKEPEAEITFGEAIDRYVQAKSSIISPSTIHGYKSLRRHAFPTIISLPLSALDEETQQRAINLYAASHTPKTVRNASGLLSAVMHLYCPKKAFSLSLPQPKKKRITIPTDDEILLLMHEVNGTDMETAIIFAATLGLRRSEISATKKTDFTFKTGKVHIQRAMVRDDDNVWHIKLPKSDAGDRIMDVPRAVLNYVEALPDDKEYLVPLNPDIIGNTFWRLKKRLNLSFRLHDLRHYYASVLLALNVPDKYAIKRTGHATTHMLKAVYQHIIENKDDELDLVINSHMDGLIS